MSTPLLSPNVQPSPNSERTICNLDTYHIPFEDGGDHIESQQHKIERVEHICRFAFLSFFQTWIRHSGAACASTSINYRHDGRKNKTMALIWLALLCVFARVAPCHGDKLATLSTTWSSSAAVVYATYCTQMLLLSLWCVRVLVCFTFY